MKSSGRRKILLIILVALSIYWLPLVIQMAVSQKQIFTDVKKISTSDAAIVFGTLVNDSGEISPLLKQRLESGVLILNSGKSKRIVVSNTARAASIMANYLYTRRIDAAVIELDTTAVTTLNTCECERNKHTPQRKVVFISQSFHLPRVLYQCKRSGLNGLGFAAETIAISDSKTPLLSTILIRTSRYTREAGLMWLVVLGVYS